MKIFIIWTRQDYFFVCFQQVRLHLNHKRVITDTANNKLKEDIKGFFDKFKFDSNDEKEKNIQSFINDETSQENFLEELSDSQIVNTV